MIYRGQVKGGVIVLNSPTELPEGLAVQVTPIEEPPEVSEGQIDPAFLIGDLAVEAGPIVRPSVASEVAVDPASEDASNPLLRMLDFAVETGIPDLSRNLDHYLYGHPKVEDDR